MTGLLDGVALRLVPTFGPGPLPAPVPPVPPVPPWPSGRTRATGTGSGTVAERLSAHLASSLRALWSMTPTLDRIEGWGAELRHRLDAGHRLLVAGNGGSAALAQHLVGELVGRFDRERPAYSALALSAETVGLTAIGNDYGYDHTFARQVEAHGREGDVFLALSTSGRSRNLLTATAAARERGLRCWAMTGPGPNPLTARADDALTVAAGATACVQDVQQVVVHLLCLAFELAGPDAGRGPDGLGAEGDGPCPG
ncbi:MAG TPA: SIS domain-containing protein [Acidimicrobiales bacterium]